MADVVLIAALRSTGSTLLSEALTELPRAFVFREPSLFRGRLGLKEADVQRLGALGVDLREVAGRELHSDPVSAARTFREEVLAPALSVVEQVGIKEIRYGPRWPDVLAELGGVRVVVLARDPRDVYISLAHRRRHRVVRLDGPFGPETVADDLQRQIDVQEQIASASGALRVRYEDLCRDPGVLRALRDFAGSPVRGTGQVGLFKDEHREVHGSAMTVLRVDRWRTEPDRRLVDEAHEVAERLGGYCRTWGYDGPVA